jgi:hypothetical protein
MPLEKPETAIGFKEWAFVCDAITQGDLSIILRKGGIHEGKKGFRFQHSAFFLFPTWFHTQAEQLRWAPKDGQTSFPPESERTSVDIDGFATLEQVWKVTDWEVVEALAPLHIWAPEVVKERFEYDEESCLHVALVRGYQLPSRWTFDYAPKYGGCRSWVTLPEEGLASLPQATPAMDASRFQSIASQVRDVLGTTEAAPVS